MEARKREQPLSSDWRAHQALLRLTTWGHALLLATRRISLLPQPPRTIQIGLVAPPSVGWGSCCRRIAERLKSQSLASQLAVSKILGDLICKQ